jgi:hypothetical protein
MTLYRYQGPPSAVTLLQGISTPLIQGGTVAFHPCHPYTKALLELGHLIPVREPT